MFANWKWKISAKCNRLQRAKFWHNITKCKVKIFTYIIIGLILSVALLEFALYDLDLRQAAKIEHDRNVFMQRNYHQVDANPPVGIRLPNETTTSNLIQEPDIQRVEYASDKISENNHSNNDNEERSKLAATVKRHSGNDAIKRTDVNTRPKMIINNLELEGLDPFEVSESQFVVYRERRMLEPVGKSNLTSEDHLSSQAAATPTGSYVTNSPDVVDQSVALNHEVDASKSNTKHPNDNNKAIMRTDSTELINNESEADKDRQENNDDDNDKDMSERKQNDDEQASKTLVDAAAAGALAGAVIGDHILSQFEQHDGEPTATGTNYHWAGRPVDPQPGNNNENINDDADSPEQEQLLSKLSDDHHQKQPKQSENLASEQSQVDDIDRGGSTTAPSFDTMPDSIESLMNSEDGKLDSSPAANTNSLPEAPSKLIPNDSGRKLNNLNFDSDSELESDVDSDDGRNRMELARGRSPHGGSSAMQGTGTFPSTGNQMRDLNAAAGHHYGKKKKKKKVVLKMKKKKVYKIKKIKKKKKKIVVIKKKKKKAKKHKVKKYKKKKHHHHKGDHGKYYMYAKVPKKKSWEFGFKKGNKKHWIERHEKGHKNKFKTKVKWYDKKSKGKGVHIWDYNHHDKKKKHHG